MDRMNRVLLAVGAPIGLAAVLGGAVAFAASNGGSDDARSGRVTYQEGEGATPATSGDATPKAGKHGPGGDDCPVKGGSGGSEEGSPTVSPSSY